MPGFNKTKHHPSFKTSSDMWKQISLAVLLAAGLLACQTKERYQSFTPGQVWLDNNNVHINAHGGGILYDNGRYYWFGETQDRRRRRQRGQCRSALLFLN